MKRSHIFGTLFFLCLLLSNTLKAQQVKLISQVTENTIKLRWAVDDAYLWLKANKYGYVLERHTLLIDGEFQTPPLKKVIRPEGFKPAPIERWEAFMEDDYVAVAAQAIYGETFELVTGAGVNDLMDKATENEARYSYGIFAADQSLKAAELSGLYYEDEEVVEGYQYLYKVFVNVPEDIVKSDTASVFTSLKKYFPLPVVPDLQVEFDDKVAVLSWNQELYINTYNSFWLERSIDGGEFLKTSEVPYVPTYDENDPTTKAAYMLDSLDDNYQKVSYRVRGISSFGDIGPPSQVVSGHGIPSFTYISTLKEHEIIDNEKVILKWDFPDAINYLTKSFTLARVHDYDKYEIIVDSIGPLERSIEDPSPISSNYYVIFTNDKYGRTTKSFPYFVQLEDSIPPVPPIELTGVVDTAGIVHLDWKDNVEKDLKGYYVFRSNFKTHHFTQLPGDLTVQSEYTDTISIKNLTQKIYYKVIAIDKRANPSDFSPMLELSKPDVIPPVSPVFNHIDSEDHGITLQWKSSSSEDVVAHLLYRKSSDDENWFLLKEVGISDLKNEYIDTDVQHGKWYNYTLVAVDKAGLESPPAPVMNIKHKKSAPYADVNDLKYSLDREDRKISLKWKYDENPDLTDFLVYRKINDRQLMLYKSMTADARSYEERFSNDTESVVYYVIAQFKDGYRTGFENEVEIRIIE